MYVFFMFFQGIIYMQQFLISGIEKKGLIMMKAHIMGAYKQRKQLMHYLRWLNATALPCPTTNCFVLRLSHKRMDTKMRDNMT